MRGYEWMPRKVAALMVKFISNYRIEVLALILVATFALGARIGAAPLVDWDEATYAEVAHEAVASGHYLNLSWNGAPYLKKPPLLFWMQAGSFKAFGESEFSARLPSVLMGVGTVLLIYLMAAAAAGRIAGIFSALIPLGFYFFIARGGREAATDAPLLFFSTLAMFALIKKTPRWLALAGAACGMAILSKGLAGMIPAIVAVLAAAIIPELREIGFSGIGIFAVAAAVVAAPWYTYQAVHNHSMFWSVFVGQETVARVVSHLEDRRQSATYTLSVYFQEIRFLWPVFLSALTFAAAWSRAGVRAALRRVPSAFALWGLWFAVAMGAACVVQTRLPWYILPALIPTALLAGSVFAGALQYRGRFGPLVCSSAVIALVILAVQTPNRWREIEENFQAQRDQSLASYTMARRAHALAIEGSELYFGGRMPLPTLVYYSQLRCNFVAPMGEAKLEYTADDFAAPAVAADDLVIVDSSGNTVNVSNYRTEWLIDSYARVAPSGRWRRPVAWRSPPVYSVP